MSKFHTTANARIQDAVKSCELIMPDVLAREQAVAETKWFGYRFMSPLAATMHFAELYREILKKHVRTHQDLERSKQVRGLRLDLFDLPSPVLTEVWNARLRADKMGVPYHLLIEFGLDFAARRKWRKPPRPGQIFGTENSGEAWIDKFARFLDGRFEACIRDLSDLPQYRIENYRGFQSQSDLRDYLVGELRNTTKPWDMLVQTYCLERRHLPVALAMRVVPKQMRKNVISSVRSELAQGRVLVEPEKRLPLISFVPSCFGIPATKLAKCNECPFASQCARLTETVANTMTDRHGSLSPLKDERDNTRKEGQRRRTRRHRALKSAAVLHSASSV